MQIGILSDIHLGYVSHVDGAFSSNRSGKPGCCDSCYHKHHSSWLGNGRVDDIVVWSRSSGHTKINYSSHNQRRLKSENLFRGGWVGFCWNRCVTHPSILQNSTGIPACCLCFSTFARAAW